ncbi:MAG: hypothetical protein WBB29_07055 [Geitlerinemataceae cyanobacterium]
MKKQKELTIVPAQAYSTGVLIPSSACTTVVFLGKDALGFQKD